jgi:uncharacterized protein with PIN domain
MANQYARKVSGQHHVSISSTAPTGSETAMPAWSRCPYCEHQLVPDTTVNAEAQLVYTTANGPSCPSCDRNPLTGRYNP